MLKEELYTQSQVDAIEYLAKGFAKAEERERIINLLIDLNAIRRDAFGSLVAFNTDGTEVIYLPGLEERSK
jgi:hypothetical protein